MPMPEVSTQANLFKLTTTATHSATEASDAPKTPVFDRVLEEHQSSTPISTTEKASVSNALPTQEKTMTEASPILLPGEAQNNLLATLSETIPLLIQQWGENAGNAEKEIDTSTALTDATDPNIAAFLQNLLHVVDNLAKQSQSGADGEQMSAMPLILTARNMPEPATTQNAGQIETISQNLILSDDASNNGKNVTITPLLNSEFMQLPTALQSAYSAQWTLQDVMRGTTAGDIGRDLKDWLSSMTAAQMTQPNAIPFVPAITESKNTGLILNTTANMTSPQIALPLDHQGWHMALSERVLWLTHQSVKGAEIHLNPPELGPLEIQIKVHQDQATVSFSSQHQVVRETIEQAVPKLREVLQHNGLHLANVNVSDQSLARQSDPNPKQRFNRGQSADENERTEVVEMQTARSPMMTNIHGYLRLIDFYA